MRSDTVSLASDYVHDLSVRQKRTPPRTEIDVRMMSRDEHERGYADQRNHKAVEEAISREDRHRARSSSFNSAGGHPASFPASGTLPISRSQYTTPPPSSSPMAFPSPSGGAPITSSDYTPPATATANARLLRNFGPRPIQFSSNSAPASGSGALVHPMSASAALSRGRGLTRPPSSSGSAASSTGTAIASGPPGARPSTADSQTLVAAAAASGRPHPLSRLPSLHGRPSSSGAGPAAQAQSGAPPSSFRFDTARDQYVESRSQSSNSPPTPSKRRWSGYDYNEQDSMMVDELAEDEDTKPDIRSSLMRRRSLDERERSSSGTVRRHSHQHSHQQHPYPYPHPVQSSLHHSHSHSRSSRPQSNSSSEHDGSRDPTRHGAREQRHRTSSTVSPTQSISSHLALSPATEPPNPYERLYPPTRNDREEYQHRHADHPYQSFQHPDARHSRGLPPPIATSSSVMGQKRSHEEMRSSSGSHSNSPTDPEQERYAHHHSSVRLRPIVPGSDAGVRVKDEPEF